MHSVPWNIEALSSQLFLSQTPRPFWVADNRTCQYAMKTRKLRGTTYL